MIIVSNKINYLKWLNITNKYSNESNLDILHLIFDDILSKLYQYKDIEFSNSYDIFDTFCKHFFNEYVYPYNQSNITNVYDELNHSDYIEMFCEQDMIDIFVYYKNNYDIFPHISSSYSLLLFLINNCHVLDIEYDNNNLSDIDDEYYQ
jgi:hypothetical protein